MSSTHIASSDEMTQNDGQEFLITEQTTSKESTSPPQRLARIVPGEKLYAFEDRFESLSKIVERTFLPYINEEEVVLHPINGDVYAPSESDSRIWIIAWSTPKKQYWSRIETRTLLGHKFPDFIQSHESVSEDKFLIRAEPKGPAIAEVVGRRIYVIVNIFELPPHLLEATFEFILGQALEIFISALQISEATLLTAVRNVSDDTILNCFEYSGSTHQRALEAEIEEITSEVKIVTKLIELESHSIYRCKHTSETEERMLITKGTGTSDLGTNECIPLEDVPFTDWAQVEFDFIISHPLIRYLPHGIPEIRPKESCTESKNMELKTGSTEGFEFLSVYTRNITTLHRSSNNLHDMGYYRLKVPIQRASHFRWYNLTRRISTQGSEPKNHPHIYADGHACLGNAERMLQDSLISGKLYDTIQIGVRFLTSCHITDPAGMSLSFWPLYEQ